MPHRANQAWRRVVSLILATALVGCQASVLTPLTPIPGATVHPSPSPRCATLPEGTFRALWARDPALQAALGCPTSYHPRITPQAWAVQTAHQPFQGGAWHYLVFFANKASESNENQHDQVRRWKIPQEEENEIECTTK